MNMCTFIATLLVVLFLQSVLSAVNLDDKFGGKSGNLGAGSIFGNRRHGKEKKKDDARGQEKKRGLNTSFDRKTQETHDQMEHLGDKISVSSFFPNNADKSILQFFFTKRRTVFWGRK